jgi:flagellin
MAMTVTNINTMQLLGIVNKTSTRQSNLLTQLSTGSRINRAADNPAGLIAMENFKAEITAVNAALENNQRADAMVATAEGGLTEISSLLTEIETLTLASVNDAALSQAEIQANQAQIDAAIEAIDRIANTTTFNGKQLLNGAQAIKTSQTSGRADNLRVYTRGQGSSDVTLNVKTTTAATSATAPSRSAARRFPAITRSS